MNYSNPLFLISILDAVIFCTAGLLMLKFPPKKINSLYGYRTKNSMKSQESWDFAQKLSALKMIKAGIIMFGFAIVGFLIIISNKLALAIGLGVLILLVIWLWVSTEKAIKNKFNNE
ncbi:SdpI family protein [Lutibacter sp.]|uniref:SdpI family protein n=1 Tax=Lutibacter sp. TaxID=1925666 RepID=UPI0027365B20|nr:SdpI family protein [Lutibacter sp.]MDP3312892.1 SdpI family protein [Lutibacter sp.]